MVDESELPLLHHPAEPPTLVASVEAYHQMVDALAAGHGPIAIDTERAHGHRYVTWAFLLQFRRAGAGTFLLDPTALDRPLPANMPELAEVLTGPEWILHAATQDLPCLNEVGLYPTSLFDTELAARILGWPKVGLGSLVARVCGVRLAKEHRAANWSRRPIPESWLTYAALDVELLADLRAALTTALHDAGRYTWALQEFEWLLDCSHWMKPPPAEPWRRISRLNSVSTPSGLAVARELWITRDELAQRLDKPPSRILSDDAIVELAKIPHPQRRDLSTIDGFKMRVAKRFMSNWQAAVARATTLPRHQLPTMRPPVTGLSAPRNWRNRHPQRHARFIAAREVVNGIAADLEMPPEVVLHPDAWHHLCWEPPTPITTVTVDEALAQRGARPWQRELMADGLAKGLCNL